MQSSTIPYRAESSRSTAAATTPPPSRPPLARSSAPWLSGGAPEFAVADGRGRIFVNLEDRSALLSFDTRSWSLALPGARTLRDTSGLAIDQGRDRLLAAAPIVSWRWWTRKTATSSLRSHRRASDATRSTPPAAWRSAQTETGPSPSWTWPAPHSASFRRSRPSWRADDGLRPENPQHLSRHRPIRTDTASDRGQSAAPAAHDSRHVHLADFRSLSGGAARESRAGEATRASSS